MPVINPAREQLQTPVAELTPSQVNMAVGVGAPKALAPDATSAMIGSLIENFGAGWEKGLQNAGAKAAVQGAIDAQGAKDALAERDDNVAKQNWLIQDQYKHGYVQAAAGQVLADYKTDSLLRAQTAATTGMDDAAYREQEHAKASQMVDKLSLYLPDMDKESAVATLQQLQATSSANYLAFQKGRAKQVEIEQDRALDKNLSASGTEFFTRFNSGDAQAADLAIEGGFSAILAAPHLDKEKKLNRVKDYLVSIAQNTEDPLVINRLQDIATKELGVNSVSVNAALYSEFKRAGAQNEARVRFDMSDRIEQIKSLPPDQQEQELKRLRSDLINYGSADILSPGTQLDIWNEANKQRVKAAEAYAVQAAVTGGASSGVLAGMFSGDLDKARNKIKDIFPDTVQGNVGLLAYGKTSKDAWAITTAQQRMSKNLADTMSSLDQLGEDGQVSTENQATIATWTQTYSQSTDVGKMALLQEVPEEWRGVVQSAAAQGPNNASNILFDDLRRLAQNKASGRYNNLRTQPTDKMVDPSGAANWFSFGDTADAQRQEARAAMEAEYRYTYSKNPESLVGKSDDDIQKMLAGNIQSRKLELEVAGKPRHVYMPPGTSLQTMMGGYKGNTEQYTAALQNVIQGAVDGAVDPSKVERVIIQAGTAGAQGQNLTATVMDKDGIMHNLSINNTQVQELAQQGYDAALAGQIKVGEQNIATRPATFYDHDAGRTVQMNVNGSNSANIQPELFSDIMVNMMEFEGYRGKKGNGSVGFGLHDNSGFPVPKELSTQWAASVLKTSLEKQYIPNVKSLLKDSSLSASPEAMKVMVDLNYHGGNGSSEPVAQAIAKVKAAYSSGSADNYQYPVATAEAEAWRALRAQPAYKQAQDSRKRYLEQNMRDWMYSLRF